MIFTYIFRNQNMLKYSEMIGAAGYRSKYADVNVSSESFPSWSTRPKCRLAKLCCCPLSRNSRSTIRQSPSDIPWIKNFIVIFTFHFRDAWPCQLMQKYVPVSKVMSCPNCLKRVPPSGTDSVKRVLKPSPILQSVSQNRWVVAELSCRWNRRSR